VKDAIFDTDRTDAQWDFLQPMLPQPKRKGRPPADRPAIINAAFYILKGGIPWRLLPKNFPPWQTVYHVYHSWVLDKT
jgi:putative transposase